MTTRQAGATDQTVFVRAVTSAGATATPAYNDAGISLWYKRGATGAVTAITPATQTSTGAHSDGGFVSLGNGWARLDLPDAAVAAGAAYVLVGGGATAWVLVSSEVLLVDHDPTTDPAGVTTLLSRLSSARAGYLDNLSAGAVATAAKLLSYFQSALRKDVTVDADIGGTYDDATDSQQALRDGLPADVWGYASRTLTTPGATEADTTTATAISRRRGDRWSISITGLGSIATRTKLWFTVKATRNDADADAWLQITEAGGLVVVYGGGSITAANAAITVDDEDDGDITITVAGVETAKLPVRSGHHDVQVLRSGAIGADTLAEGTFTVTADVTRATS